MRRLRTLIALLLLTLSAGWISAAHAGDVRVWVNTNSGVYHCPGGQYYGNTKKGKYVPESQALAQGNRPAYGQHCSSDAGPAPATARGLVGGAPAGGGTKVWVNSSSHVYHCPGTRYYGATQRGRYMSESEAIATGNRPAYGARC